MEIKLACVPEQVNLPLLQATSLVQDVVVKIVDAPQGTGYMLDLLERGACDVALTVADAFITARGSGKEVYLAGIWVKYAICIYHHHFSQN